MEEMKFKVHNEAHSRAIQEKLHELGCRWIIGDLPSFFDKPFLFVDNNFITYSYDENVFNESENELTTLDDLYRVEPKKEIPEYTIEELQQKLGEEFKIVKK